MATEIRAKITADTQEATNNVNQFGDALNDAAGQLDKVTGGAVSAFRGMISGVKGAVSSLKTLKGAIIGTGIGALVVLVGSAVEWFQNFEGGVKLVEKAMNAFNGVLGQLGTALDLLLKGKFAAAGEALLKVGDAALAAADATDKLFAAQEKLFKLQETNIVNNAKLNQELELQRKILDDTTLSAEQRLAALDEVNRLSEEIQQNAIDENKLQKEILEEQIKLENNYEKSRELKLQLAQVNADLINQEGRLDLIRTEAARKEREIFAIQESQRLERLRQEIELQKQLDQLLKEDTEEPTMDDITDADKLFKDDFAKLDYQRQQKADLNEFWDKKETEMHQQYVDEQNEIDKNALMAQQEIERLKVEAVSATFNTLSALTTLFAKDTEKSQEKAFKINKGLALSEALVSTFLSANKAYASQLAIPTPDAPIRASVAAAIATATGLANVALIAKQKFQKSGTSAGGGSAPRGNFGGGIGGGFDPTSPTISALPQFSNIGIPNQNQQNQNIRAYVVSNEITDAQALDKRLNQRSTL